MSGKQQHKKHNKAITSDNSARSYSLIERTLHHKWCSNVNSNTHIIIITVKLNQRAYVN